MASLDLPDPLENTPQLSLDNADDLISQLAGEEIDRMIGPDDEWRPQAPARSSQPTHASEVSRAAQKPVEDLAAELNEVFEKIRTEQIAPATPEIDTTEPDPITLPEPVLAMRKYDELDVRENEGRQSLLDPIPEPPLPAIFRPFAWLNAPVAQLTGKSRLMMNVVCLVSFVGSVAALIYVLKLRQGL